MRYGEKKQIYCEVCGNPLKEEGSYCKVCSTSGNKVSLKSQELNEEGKIKIAIEEEQIEQVCSTHDSPKPFKAEEVYFDSVDIKSDENSLFTFSKENEEFQKVLDREYEKIESKELVAAMPLPIPNIEIHEEEQEIDEELAPFWIENEEKKEKDEEKKDEKQYVKEDSEKKKAKRATVGKIILLFVICILIIETACLSIKFFSPDSQAAKQITKYQVKFVRTLTHWKDSIKSQIAEKSTVEASTDNKKIAHQVEQSTKHIPAVKYIEENPVRSDDVIQNKEVQKSPTSYSTGPTADKNILIKSQADVNKNIQVVRANKNLFYQTGRIYKTKDVNNSKPIRNNVWMITEDSRPLFYDKEIVKTLMAFNSKWNDYVNGGSKEVIKLTKEGSQAYKNVTTFSKVGKVRQSFTLLEIGEIRKGNKNFYAWTHEEIKEVERGKTTYKTYYWIYNLEPTEGKMKIVDYYKY